MLIFKISELEAIDKKTENVSERISRFMAEFTAHVLVTGKVGRSRQFLIAEKRANLCPTFT